jgi:hypothetical protein
MAVFNNSPRAIVYGFESLKDLFDVLLVPAVGGAVALFWPELQARHKRNRFENLIARELEELAPFPKQRDWTCSSWTDHLKKDFIHKRILEDPSQNRDFILSLDASLVYHLSQLWDARKTGDNSQWLFYLKNLADRFGGNVAGIYGEWKVLIKSYQTASSAAPAKDSPKHSSMSELSIAELVRVSLEGKLRAIGGYDDILWKIRVGYAAVLYGTLSLALGKDLFVIIRGKPWTVGLLVLGFTVAAVVNDLGFQVKKLKVVVSRDAVMHLSLKGLLAQEGQQVATLCRISGEMRLKDLPDHARKQFWFMLWSNVVWTLLPLYTVAPLAAIVAIYIAA